MKRIAFLLLLLFPVVAFATGSTTFTCSNADVDALEEVCSVRIGYTYTTCSYEFTVGTAALSDFDVTIGQESGEVVIATAAADYTTPGNFMFWASGALTTAGTSGTHMMVLNDLGSVKTIVIDAAGTNSVITGNIACRSD